MKKVMAMLMFVLAGCLVATAQSNTSGDSMKHDKMMKHDGGKMKSMTGCIAEKDGKYMMMNKAHPDGVMLMSSEDLKPHIGHKVRVSGMMEKMGMSGDSMKSDDGTMKSGDTSMKSDKAPNTDETTVKSDKTMKSDDTTTMKSDDKAMKSDDKMPMKHDDMSMGMMDMKVSSMKMISEQCDMSKMTDKK